MLYIVVQKPKAKFTGVLRVVVAIVEAESVPHAVRVASFEKDRDYTKPVAELLSLGKHYCI